MSKETEATNTMLTEQIQAYRSVKMYANGEPVGYAEIEEADSEIWLNNFAIREDCRGKGYGSKMLKMLISKYGVNTLSCACDNSVAFRMYARAGFAIVDVLSSFSNGLCYKMQRGGKV